MKSTLRRTALACLVACLPVSVALGATMKGKVVNTHDLLNPVWNEAKDPNSHRYSFREFSSTVPPDMRVLRGHLSKELCIVALGAAGTALKTPIRVTISGGRTSPVTLVVPEGQEIQFENKDPWVHSVYEVSGGGGLSKGTQQPGAARNWTPPKPGKYELRDELFPSLRSWIVVEPRAMKSVYPNRKGDFQMDLEPGTYTVQGYFNGDPVGEALEIEVKPAPAEQQLANPLKAGQDKKKDEKKDDKTPAKAGG